MKRILFLIPLLAALLSCEVETLDPGDVVLNPPLGLSLSNVTGGFALSWYAFNDEQFFTGFQILCTTNAEDILSNRAPMVPNTASTNLFYTMSASVMSYPGAFSYTVTAYPDGSAFQSGVTYYFAVRSYTAQFGVSSLPSNLTNGVY